MSDYRIGASCDHIIVDSALTLDGVSPYYTSTLTYPSNNDPTSMVIREFSATEGLDVFLKNVNGITNFTLISSSTIKFNTLGFPPSVSYAEGSTFVYPPKLYLATYYTTTLFCPLCFNSNIRRDLTFDQSGSLSTVSGHDKVEQQVLKILLTATQSNRLHLDYGANLPDYIGQRLDLLLEFKIMQTVQNSILFVIDQQRQSTQDLPLDEIIARMADLQVRRDETDPRKVIITVKVTTADLFEVTAQLPLLISI